MQKKMYCHAEHSLHTSSLPLHQVGHLPTPTVSGAVAEGMAEIDEVKLAMTARTTAAEKRIICDSRDIVSDNSEEDSTCEDGWLLVCAQNCCLKFVLPMHICNASRLPAKSHQQLGVKLLSTEQIHDSNQLSTRYQKHSTSWNHFRMARWVHVEFGTYQGKSQRNIHLASRRRIVSSESGHLSNSSDFFTAGSLITCLLATLSPHCGAKT
ncbi:uncharacterized protein EDB93DRAFT_389554 [Suillus bovinus]|uniref:uncharacterized protein n=1 Tax=Suillus bovinus TaxID=48563 RepID=UPI001B866C5B|nr:uncharacterized protein EDB93DRAFT_389554 [Suillus bovinus]KAG2147815.1 hypothetical protein EDB93DRAFT_389554 [Suillus bovinus]